MRDARTPALHFNFIFYGELILPVVASLNSAIEVLGRGPCVLHDSHQVNFSEESILE